VKLLIDHNLSFRLVRRLEDLFPGSDHVRTLSLEANPEASFLVLE
jgi:predicted nuclease of predicted toxin-antitoxin system